MKTLSDLRRQMDGLSLQIVHLLLERKELAERIIAEKCRLNLSPWDPEREKELLKFLVQGLTKDERHYIQEIFNEIFQRTRGSSRDQ